GLPFGLSDESLRLADDWRRRPRRLTARRLAVHRRPTQRADVGPRRVAPHRRRRNVDVAAAAADGSTAADGCNNVSRVVHGAVQRQGVNLGRERSNVAVRTAAALFMDRSVGQRFVVVLTIRYHGFVIQIAVEIVAAGVRCGDVSRFFVGRRRHRRPLFEFRRRFPQRSKCVRNVDHFRRVFVNVIVSIETD
uniref:Uncharacterized protein n=1 Tax=Romanomermis culicivorax TaxID=13658 RepID=A0A915IT63_ROMCU